MKAPDIAGDRAAWAEDVLRYWFDELGPEGWFARAERIDAEIRTRFAGLHARLEAADGAALADPRAVLAAVIVLDQFSRNLFRGEARAFASDERARRLARQVLAAGLDDGLASEQRLFLYLPFEHSEDPDDQSLAVDLISRLGDPSWTRYALAHQAIIQRFGRFPHRNAVLGRATTAEEQAFLQEPMSSF